MNRSSVSERLTCDFKIPPSCSFLFLLNLCDFVFVCLLSRIDASAGNSLCAELPDGEFTRTQRSEVTDSCF